MSVEEYMSYFVVRNMQFLCGRIHGIFYFGQCGVAVRKNTWHILWPADIDMENGCAKKCTSYLTAEGDNSLEW